MFISVKAHISDAMSMLDDVHRRHIPFAAVYAATLTARDVKTHQVRVMQRVFDRPTPYVLNALRVKPATRNDPVASVEFKEFGGTPVKRMMNPNIHGGGRSLKSHERQLGGRFHAPGREIEREVYGNVRGSVYRRILSQLNLSTNVDANASDSVRSKRKRKGDVYFKLPNGMVLYRKGRDVKVALVPIKAPVYRKRFPFYEEARMVVADKYPENFITALNRAMATSNYKAKWR